MRPLINFSILIILPIFIHLSSADRGTGADATDEQTIEKYCNSRFGFCLQYPKSIFVKQHGADNDDGMHFSSEDGNITAQVSGRYNIESSTMLDLYQDLVDQLAADNKMVEIQSNELSKTTCEATFVGDKESTYYRMLLGPNNVIISLVVVVPKGMEELLFALKKDMQLEAHI